MAQLRDTVVAGSLRATDTLFSTTAQFQILRVPTSSNGTTFGPGSNNNLLKSNGTSVYWTTLVASDIPTISITDKTSGTLPVTRGGTGVTAIANIQAGKDGDGNTISSTYLKLSGGTMTGLITTTAGGSHYGIKIGNTYINAINGNIIFQNNDAIRFGADDWDWNKWAGLRFDATNKIIYLGIADKSIFSGNDVLSNGTLSLINTRYFKMYGKDVFNINTAIDNTAFTSVLSLFHNESTESSTSSFNAAQSSWGITFERQWNSGSICTKAAGIFAYGINSWRTGLVFRTKTGTANTGAHDTTALYLNHDGSATFANTVNATTFVGALTGNVTGDVTGSSGSCTGNAATATRINGNLGAITDADGHNIWVSSSTGANGIPKYISGIYVVPSTKTIVATTFSGNLTGNVTGNVTGSSGSCTGNAATATTLSANATDTTKVFFRGDRTWSNVIKQTSNAALGIDTNLKIGTAKKDLNFAITNGSGTGINDGYAGGITWGDDNSAYAGIYYQTSGSYGSRLIFGTTNSYANGVYARMIITHEGKIGIGKLTPSSLLDVNGTVAVTGDLNINNSSSSFVLSLVNDKNSGMQGLKSSGYGQYDGGMAWVEGEAWLVYRDASGSVILNGNAYSATRDGSGNTITSTYLKLSGGSMTGKLTFNKVQNAIAYQGTKNGYDMIKFIDNTSDVNGNGIYIGGGGATIIGGGESADTAAGQVSGGSEILYLCNDGDVNVFTNMQNGWDSRKTFTFGSNGNIVLPAGCRIGESGDALYLGNSGNQNWIYAQDMASQDSSKWKLHTNGNAEFNGTVTADTLSLSNALSVSNGGTGATSKSSARTNLGIKYKDISISKGATSASTGLSTSITVIAALCTNPWSAVCTIQGIHPNNGVHYVVCKAVETGNANVRVFYFD